MAWDNHLSEVNRAYPGYKMLGARGLPGLVFKVILSGVARYVVNCGAKSSSEINKAY